MTASDLTADAIFRPRDVRPGPTRRIPRTTLDQLADLPALTSTASDVLEGFITPMVVGANELTPRLPARAIVGHAVTLRYLGSRPGPMQDRSTEGLRSQLAHHAAFETAVQGDVLVIDATGAPVASVCGGMGALDALNAGLSGFVVDGAIRDVDEYRAIGFPVWSRSVTPRTGKGRLEGVSINAPVSCGGHQICPGDLVLADDTGACFIPAELAEPVIELVLNAGRAERALFEAGRHAGSSAPMA